MTLIVGLTGGIGSGKSIVTAHFATLGVPIIDADVIAHQLSYPPSIALDKIKQCFGSEYLTEDGALNRAKMRAYIFQNTAARRQLEFIFHRLIYHQIRDRLKEKITDPYLILSIPLLFESKYYKPIVHRTLVVDCPIALQITRTMKRSNLSYATVAKIIATQINREQRLAKADDFIENSQGIDQIPSQVVKLHYFYLQQSKRYK